MEAFLLARIAAGAGLPGTYPPNEATKAAVRGMAENRGKRDRSIMSNEDRGVATDLGKPLASSIPART